MKGWESRDQTVVTWLGCDIFLLGFYIMERNLLTVTIEQYYIYLSITSCGSALLPNSTPTIFIE